MELRRFFTAGEVDDGKSTLIGRLFLDAGRIHEDQLAALKGNLAHFTDGLRAERAQGITMDVAYRFFETPRRKFIVADAPGHLQYIRHMVSAASLADAAVILVDATRGVSTQTRRHAWLACWLGVPAIAFVVNKMDQRQFSEQVFTELKAQLGDFPEAIFIPASALLGDNIILRSTQTAWYEGPSLMGWLDTIPTRPRATHPARFPVQHVLRDGSVTGQLIAGDLQQGETLQTQRGPVTLREIHSHPQQKAQAKAGEALRLVLSSGGFERGDLLYTGTVPRTHRWEAEWLFFEETTAPLSAQTQAWQGAVATIRPDRVWDWEQQAWAASGQPSVPLLQRGQLELDRPLVSDEFGKNGMGQMVLVDSISGRTVAAVLLKKAL